MRVLVISDIHANLTAFKAVLEDAEGEWDKIWFLGDLVGYGPDPNECTELLRQHEHLALSGNHDWAVLDRIDITTFNKEAQQAIRWTQDMITEETQAYLDELPSSQVEEPFTLAHASPRQPVWEYVLDPYTAALNFQYFDTRYCLVGHTHVPIWFEEDETSDVVPNLPSYHHTLQLNQRRLIINPGSVGQPRDSDPRAAYALLDLEELTWSYRRVDYEWEETQQRMRQAEMPSRLINRLEYGW